MPQKHPAANVAFSSVLISGPIRDERTTSIRWRRPARGRGRPFSRQRRCRTPTAPQRAGVRCERLRQAVVDGVARPRALVDAADADLARGARASRILHPRELAVEPERVEVVVVPAERLLQHPVQGDKRLVAPDGYVAVDTRESAEA